MHRGICTALRETWQPTHIGQLRSVIGRPRCRPPEVERRAAIRAAGAAPGCRGAAEYARGGQVGAAGFDLRGCRARPRPNPPRAVLGAGRWWVGGDGRPDGEGPVRDRRLPSRSVSAGMGISVLFVSITPLVLPIACHSVAERGAVIAVEVAHEHASHDILFVALSMGLALVGSFAALVSAIRIPRASGRGRHAWVAAAAVSLG